MMTGAATTIAIACAGTMGFAIQRGATCTVAAIDELMNQRTGNRLMALAEAAFWVASGLLVARGVGLLSMLPKGVAPSGWTVAGGVLLGLGAWTNGACSFGSIARIGSGDWAYVASPFGFLAGAWSAHLLFGDVLARQGMTMSWLAQIPAWVGWAVLPLAIFRVIRVAGWSHRPVWDPHQATVIIGLMFVVLFVVAGPWSYTDVLVSAAKGMRRAIGFPLLLFVALFAGAGLGGWTAGSFKHRPVSWSGMTRCLFGGAMMGCGSLLVPGGNDGLILVGLPLLLPHAWIGIAVMCLTVAIALRVEKGWA